MFWAVVLLQTVGCVMAGPAYLNHLEMDEPMPPPASKTQQRVLEYPSESRIAADQHEPAAGPEYKLSYADYQVTWESFKNVFNKQYPTEREEKKRFGIFMETVNLIENHNWKYHNGQSSFYMDINHFSDLTNEEFRTLNRLQVDRPFIHPTEFNEYYPSGTAVPDSVNWKDKGYVTSVKNQKKCGSCWAFTLAGTVEGQWFKNSSNLVDLSVQQQVDCSRNYSNRGCNGGYQPYSWRYVIDHGLESETSYPYEAKDNQCRFDKSKVVANVSTFKRVGPRYNETALKEAVGSIGPISAGIDAWLSSFQNYGGGIYDDSDCGLGGLLNHDLLVVGYGSLNGQDYWIAKNRAPRPRGNNSEVGPTSMRVTTAVNNDWSELWGDKGYIMMSRNKDNQCGIASDAYYPIV